MKLSGAAAERFCAEPDEELCGALLHGPDEGLLNLRRSALLSRIAEGDEMRISRLDPAEIRKDPAALDAALRARGFFPGPRVVLVEPATDAVAASLSAALVSVDPEDAFLLVVAPGLGGRSSLRKLFDSRPDLVSLGLYPAVPTVAELRSRLSDAGLACGIGEGGLRALAAAAAEMDAGSQQRLIEKIALFALGRDEQLADDAVEMLLPRTTESGLDVLVAAVADGQAREVGPLITRLSAAGISPTRILIATNAHFRSLLSIAAAPDGAERALSRLRPPAWGPRRDALLRQTRRWGAPRLEMAVRLLFAADRTLRSPGARPDRAIVERALIRLAMAAG